MSSRHAAHRAMAAAALRQALSSGPTTLTIRGRSMWPVLRSGQRVWVRPLLAGEPRPGAVIAFEDASGGQVVVHRLMARDATTLSTRGVARRQSDPSVPTHAVIGVVCATELGRLRIGENALRRAAAAADWAHALWRRRPRRCAQSQDCLT